MTAAATRCASAGVLAILAAATPAAGQPRPPTEVSPVTISPLADAPKLSASFPAEGAAVSPGALVLKLTFDQKMAPDAFAVGAGEGQAPACLKTPRLLADEKTFVLLCSTRGGASYDIALNAAGEGGFTNIGGQRAETARLRFTTTTAAPVRTMEEAMKMAGLTGLDVPVQEQP